MDCGGWCPLWRERQRKTVSQKVLGVIDGNVVIDANVVVIMESNLIVQYQHLSQLLAMIDSSARGRRQSITFSFGSFYLTRTEY